MIYVEVFKLSDTVDIKLMISKCDILSCKSYEIFNPLFAYRPNDINNKSKIQSFLQNQNFVFLIGLILRIVKSSGRRRAVIKV